MADLLIEPTKNSPLIDFSSAGKLVLAGNAQVENAKEFYDPVIDWIVELRSESVNFDIVLEYINTASAKRLFEILRKLDTNANIKYLTINWFYEEDDTDHLETGQILSESLKKARFNYTIYEK
jgi:sulfatase maturation enzyme AslB (radical SAM superfamily)